MLSSQVGLDELLLLIEPAEALVLLLPGDAALMDLGDYALSRLQSY